MTPASRSVPEELLATVHALSIDEGYLRHVIESITAIGSCARGFRTSGTLEDVAVAAFVSDEMRDIGLDAVTVEPVTVDAWRFIDAGVTVGGLTFDAVSFGGVPGTGPDGVTGVLVDVADATLARLDSLPPDSLAGRLALVDWRSRSVHPSAVVLELARRGAAGMIISCPRGGPWFQAAGALGGFDGQWASGCLPMVVVSKEDATLMRVSALGQPTTIRLIVEEVLGAEGHNVVGHLRGREAGPVLVGAHHDAWFSGAFDNTSGVAVMLAMARGLVDIRYRPRHTICFTSRTAEEYGAAGAAYDWCVGAWKQVTDTHPEWATSVPFHLCVEASGHRRLRSVLEAPVELEAWAQRIGEVAEREGWAPTGWRVSPPVAGTEQWPLLVAGIPGVACYSWEELFGETEYHTQLDTIELLDLAYLSAQTRCYCLALLDADRDPDGILDHRRRADQLEAVADEHGHESLLHAARAHADATGRAAFTPVGRSLFALDTDDELCLPHEQSARDLDALRRALAALNEDDLGAAASALTSVGRMRLSTHLSAEALARHSRRYHPDAQAAGWGAASHLTPVLDVCDELAVIQSGSLGDAARERLRESLRRKERLASQRVDARLGEMAEALARRSRP